MSPRVSKYNAYFDLVADVWHCKQPDCDAKFKKQKTSTASELLRHFQNSHDMLVNGNEVSNPGDCSCSCFNSSSNSS